MVCGDFQGIMGSERYLDIFLLKNSVHSKLCVSILCQYSSKYIENCFTWMIFNSLWFLVTITQERDILYILETQWHYSYGENETNSRTILGMKDGILFIICISLYFSFEIYRWENLRNDTFGQF